MAPACKTIILGGLYKNDPYRLSHWGVGVEGPSVMCCLLWLINKEAAWSDRAELW